MYDVVILVQTARQSTRRLRLVDNDGDDGVCGLPEKVNVGTRRTASFTATLLVGGSATVLSGRDTHLHSMSAGLISVLGMVSTR